MRWLRSYARGGAPLEHYRVGSEDELADAVRVETERALDQEIPRVSDPVEAELEALEFLLAARSTGAVTPSWTLPDGTRLFLG